MESRLIFRTQLNPVFSLAPLLVLNYRCSNNPPTYRRWLDYRCIPLHPEIARHIVTKWVQVFNPKKTFLKPKIKLRKQYLRSVQTLEKWFKWCDEDVDSTSNFQLILLIILCYYLRRTESPVFWLALDACFRKNYLLTLTRGVSRIQSNI